MNFFIRYWNRLFTALTIGDFAHGGIVFHLDESGKHGLVCAPTDQHDGIRWYAGTFGKTQATGRGIFAGAMNTAIIISSHVAIGDDLEPYAAKICAELELNDFGDWYLPSKNELVQMYTNLARNGIGDFKEANYWSSTETRGRNGEVARVHSFFYPPDPEIHEKSELYPVRAVRAF